jgi:hypothetical protein
MKGFESYTAQTKLDTVVDDKKTCRYGTVTLTCCLFREIYGFSTICQRIGSTRKILAILVSPTTENRAS